MKVSQSDIQIITKHADYNKTCTLQQNMQVVKKHVEFYKTCRLLQNMQTVTKVRPDMQWFWENLSHLIFGVHFPKWNVEESYFF